MAFKDLCLLTVPKSVAITNPRLNFLAYVLFLATLGVVLWNIFMEKPYSAQVKSHTKVLLEIGTETGPSAMALNITGHSMCPPGQSVETVDALMNAWSNFSANDVRQHAEALFAPAHWLKRNPPLLQASSTCLPMCTGMADASHCMSPSTFMDQRDSSHVALWSARHILRRDGILVDSFVGLSVVAATIDLSYSYALEQDVPSLSRFLFNPSRVGDHTTTQTILIDSKGVPGKRFPFGSKVKLTLTELLGAAQRLPQHLLEGTEPSWELFRDGLELNVEVMCYNDDVELKRSGVAGSGGDWELGATIASPVCVLRVTHLQCCASFAAPEVTAGGSVALNRAVVVRASVGTSIMWLPSFNSLLLAFTSALVLLQLPLKFVRWFTLTCLGQLSRLYKRVIVQNFDIQQEAATMAVMLMSNSVSFLELSDCVVGRGEIPGISRERMEERLRAALQQRRHVLSDAELSAFVACCFDAMQFGEGDHLDIAKELDNLAATSSFRGMTPSSISSGGTLTKQGTSNVDIIDIDTFNVHCSTGHAVDLQAAVELFDDDRHRNFLERLFTPKNLNKALQRVQQAKQESDPEILEEVDLERDMIEGQPTIENYPSTPSTVLSLARPSERLSLEDKKATEREREREREHDRFTLLDLLEREREREQASNRQAQLVATLQDRISTLEAEMHKEAAALQSLESEGTFRYSQGEEQISKVEEKIQTRLAELDCSLNNRLDSVLSGSSLPVQGITLHSNRAADLSTQNEHRIEVAELSDRLALLDAELRHQSLAMKETLKRTVASLEAQVRQQRIQMSVFVDELREERESRDRSNGRIESRLAGLEVTLEQTRVSAQNHRSAEVSARTEGTDRCQHDSVEMTSVAATKAGSIQSISATPSAPYSPNVQDDILPSPYHQAAARKNGFKDRVCTRGSPRMCG